MRSFSARTRQILGDLHNFFGDTNAIPVGLDDDGEVNLDVVIEGDTVWNAP